MQQRKDRIVSGLVWLTLTIALAACSSSSKYITAKEWGKDYPFTIDGSLECIAGAIVFKGGGDAYAVNGTATGRGYADIKPIWKDNPALPGTKIGVGEVISEGQKLCN